MAGKKTSNPLVQLDNDAWVDPHEVIGVEDRQNLGYVCVLLRGGQVVQTTLRVDEAIFELYGERP